MIDHVSVGVRSLAAAARFYDGMLGAIGYARLAERPASIGFGRSYPCFWLNLRAGMPPVAADTGCHVGLRARSPEEVEAFHRVALAAGGRDDGAPALRRYSRVRVFAAFIRDPDGNRIEAAVVLPDE